MRGNIEFCHGIAQLAAQLNGSFATLQHDANCEAKLWRLRPRSNARQTAILSRERPQRWWLRQKENAQSSMIKFSQGLCLSERRLGVAVFPCDQLFRRYTRAL